MIPRHLWVWATAVHLALAGTAVAAAESGEPTPGPPVMLRPTDDATRLTELRRAVRRDRAQLIALITEPRSENAPPLRDHPKLREIALRLPDLQAKLLALTAARRAPDPAVPAQ